MKQVVQAAIASSTRVDTCKLQPSALSIASSCHSGGSVLVVLVVGRGVEGRPVEDEDNGLVVRPEEEVGIGVGVLLEVVVVLLVESVVVEVLLVERVVAGGGVPPT